MSDPRAARARAALGSVPARVAGLPRGARLGALGVLIAAGFVAVVLPLFSGGGAPQAQITGFLPATVPVGQAVRADLGVDNIGDSIISPLCIAISGDGATLAGADFQGLEQIAAVGNRVCGGQLTAQETISVTVTFTLHRRGAVTVELVPQQGATVIGAPFSTSVTAS